MSDEHNSIESGFRTIILQKASVCEFYIETIISIILTQDLDRMSDLKLVLLNQSQIPFQYKIDVFESIMEKYHNDLLEEELLNDLRDLRKMRNKIAHYTGAGTEDAKKDEENKRIRLQVYEGLKIKEEFYKYTECKEMIVRYSKTVDKLNILTEKIMKKTFPNFHPESKS